MEIFPGISMDAGIRFGKPCIAGTRVDVATVIGALGAGESTESVAENYALTREQTLAALRYAAHVAAHQPPPPPRVHRPPRAGMALDIDAATLTAEQFLEQRIPRQAVVSGDVAEDGCQRPDPQVIVLRNRDVMLLWLLAGQAHVAARLPADPIAEYR